MADHICSECGTVNDAAAQFCLACDAYLGWDRGAATLDGEPLTRMIPTVVESVATERTMTDGGGEPSRVRDRPPSFPPGGSRAGGSGSLAGPALTAGAPGPTNGDPAAPAATRAVAPLVTVQTPEVTLVGAGPALVTMQVVNPSTIVDAYSVHPSVAPPWLTVRHGEVSLMPGREAALVVEIGAREDILVFAQRLHLGLMVRSQADPEKAASVEVVVTVPPTGPRVTLQAHPTLLRLADETEGSFAVHLDNRAANYPQVFRMSGTDPEAVVAFSFDPEMVQVPPGQMVEVRGRFRAPAPDPGTQLSRQLTVTATNDEGSSSATLTVQQRTAPALVDAPIALRLLPSELRAVDAGVAELEVMIDNRAGHRTRHLALNGRDPARAVGFFFLPQQVAAEAGQVTRVLARVQTHLPPPGESLVRPFTVVASDGTSDIEAPGSLVVSTSAAPITTAALELAPENLTRANTSQGTFRLHVDNSRGARELRVRLFGKDADGVARFTFSPPELVVPARGVAAVDVDVRAPRPPSGEQAVRTLTVAASDGTSAVEAEATFTQVSSDRRGLWRVLLVLLGALLVGIGALTSWSPAFSTVLPTPAWIESLVRNPPDVVNTDDPATLVFLIQPPVRALVVLCAVLMLLGLSGRGRLIRTMAILAVLLTVGFLVVAQDIVAGLGIGVFLVVIGAVLAYIGGVLSRSR